MERFEFKKSNKKIMFLLIASFALSTLGVFMIMSPEKFISFLFRNEKLILIAGIVSFVFFGIAFAFILKKNLTSQIGIVIDENGIIDNSSAVSLGFIDWKDVKAIRKNNVLSTQFLLIDVNNPNEYLNRAKNRIILSLLKSNLNVYGTPISISSTALKCDFDELQKIINDSYKSYLEKKEENINEK
ncbi:STM3941 family protein [Flavobacterium sp. 22076]|jgi:hypothetical protein|uniref:STM3941 family protein n=1 Tax=unclassified Flavobacterium TaxID=196869 RepID=UPI003F86DFC7